MSDKIVALSAGIRRTAIAGAATALCAGLCTSAAAFDINTGNEDLTVRFDNTIRYNLGKRIDTQSQAILRNVNSDDGDRNFGNKSIVTNRIDVLSELDVVYQRQFGARVSAAGWYDAAYSGGFDNTSLATSNHLVNGAPAFGLSPYANRFYHGPSGEWLDAFVFGGFELGSMPVTVRAGRHTVAWGEALLGGGAIHGVSYAQAPLDQAKSFGNPGIEAKELFRPLTQISGQIQATPELSIAGQYYFDWEAGRLPEAGTYLGFGDHYFRGGESLIQGATRIRRGDAITPKERGDWGLAARWNPQWLDGTMGFYYRNFSDKLPQILLVSSAQRYFFNYASDIDLYGVSLSKQIFGISFGADLNYRRNMPLVSDNAIAIPSLAALPAQGNSVGARGNTVHAVVNAVSSLGSSVLYDNASVAAEMTYSRWLSVSQGAQFFKGRNNYVGIDKVSKDSVGFAINFTPTWFQIFSGADLSMPISYSRGLLGNSAVTSGGNKGAGQYSVGLGLDLYSKYRFDLKYIDYFGKSTLNPTTGANQVSNGSTANLKDRGAVYLTFKTAF
ncbi:DUF1302 domain-containing protein [Noviherbaspirillum saxi]|uniref:DUF1302 domain-containing protein n=1 Tax=Noviherbaspirillum saxi TaxID=2320863 RepID=A0A3A3FVE5_9BURK|nr:DUF1302 domain-containing protein [Noviherbaspirillum saxi]RJF98548.1 DUF1302 domain-containing protein [Noviherbaspirillum saxi]